MNRLIRYAQTIVADHRLLCRALGQVIRKRVRLWIRPFTDEERRLIAASSPKQGTAFHDDRFISRSARAVRLASRLVPRATCLTQALALNAMLASAGVTSTIRIGVARSRTGAFAAHAWVLVDGQVVIGGNVAPYAVLLDLQGGVA